MNKKDNKEQINETELTNVQDQSQDTIDNTQDIDYDLVTSGPLYFDPKLIRPGYMPFFVADTGGNIEMYKRWGYEIVTDDFNVGSNHASTTTRFGSAVTVQSKCGILLVLMAIKKELHDKLMAHREKKNSERTKALGHIDGIPDKYQQVDGKPISHVVISNRKH